MFLLYLYLEQRHINKQNCKKQASKQKTNRLHIFPGNGIQCVNKATGTVAVAPETTVDITASFTRCLFVVLFVFVLVVFKHANV